MKILNFGSVLKSLGEMRFYLSIAIFASVFAMAPLYMATAQSSVAAASGKPTPTPNPTPPPNPTATLYDFDTLGSTLMRFRGDGGMGQATYVSPLSSFVSGEWSLNLANQSSRMVYITPNVPINALQPQGPPAGYYWKGVSSRTGCFDQSGNLIPLANILTLSGNCKLGVNFDSGGTLYKLLMSPFPLSGGGDPPPTCPAWGCPATGAVKVTCNAQSSGQCVNWTIEPNTATPNANVANLYRYASSRGKATWVFIGQYYNTFRINVRIETY